MRHRGIMVLDLKKLGAVLGLEEGNEIHAVIQGVNDIRRGTVQIIVDGPGMPEVPEGCEPVMVAWPRGGTGKRLDLSKEPEIQPDQPNAALSEIRRLREEMRAGKLEAPRRPVSKEQRPVEGGNEDPAKMV